MAARGLAIRADVVTPAELRRRAKKEPRRRTAQRMLALANALDGMSRADPALALGLQARQHARPLRLHSTRHGRARRAQASARPEDGRHRRGMSRGLCRFSAPLLLKPGDVFWPTICGCNGSI